MGKECLLATVGWWLTKVYSFVVVMMFFRSPDSSRANDIVCILRSCVPMRLRNFQWPRYHTLGAYVVIKTLNAFLLLSKYIFFRFDRDIHAHHGYLGWENFLSHVFPNTCSRHNVMWCFVRLTSDPQFGFEIALSCTTIYQLQPAVVKIDETYQELLSYIRRQAMYMCVCQLYVNTF